MLSFWVLALSLCPKSQDCIQHGRIQSLTHKEPLSAVYKIRRQCARTNFMAHGGNTVLLVVVSSKSKRIVRAYAQLNFTNKPCIKCSLTLACKLCTMYKSSLATACASWISFWAIEQEINISISIYYAPKLKVLMHMELWSVKMFFRSKLAACYCDNTNVEIQCCLKVYHYLLSRIYVGHLSTAQQRLSLRLFYRGRSLISTSATGFDRDQLL